MVASQIKARLSYKARLSQHYDFKIQNLQQLHAKMASCFTYKAQKKKNRRRWSINSSVKVIQILFEMEKYLLVTAHKEWWVLTKDDWEATKSS